MVSTIPTLLIAVSLWAVGDATQRSADLLALKPLAGLVGEWKGTGQPIRGSVKGAWTESGAWTWEMTDRSASLRFESPQGKFLKSVVIRPLTSGAFELTATLPDGKKRAFQGKPGPRNTVVFTAQDARDQGPGRITLSPLHDTRFLMLMEAKDADASFSRLGEIGFTRQGVAFATGDSSPVCIVTEGRGTIAVSHKGKTYFVCCSGCKDLFEEDPEGILAEAERRSQKKPK